jgi:hypothetical protein
VVDLLEGARDELIPQPLEATSDAPVHQAIADTHDQAAQQAGIDLDVERDATTRLLFESVGELLDLVRVRSEADTAVSRW